MSTFAENFCHRDGQKSWLRICAQLAELRFFFSVRGIAIDVDVHVVEKKNMFKIWHELLSHRWVIFICIFLVMGLEGDTVCANDATHPSRPG